MNGSFLADVNNWLITEIANPVFGLLTIVSIIYFIIIVIQYFTAYKNGDDLSKLKMKLVWGLFGLVLVTSCWTIVNVIDGLSYKQSITSALTTSLTPLQDLERGTRKYTIQIMLYKCCIKLYNNLINKYILCIHLDQIKAGDF